MAYGEQQQYPDKFPCTGANPAKCDPLNDKSGSIINLLLPTNGGTEQVISKGGWTKLSAKFPIPQGAYIRNAMIRIKGGWKTYKLYEGGIFVDHVAGVNWFFRTLFVKENPGNSRDFNGLKEKLNHLQSFNLAVLLFQFFLCRFCCVELFFLFSDNCVRRVGYEFFVP